MAFETRLTPALQNIDRSSFPLGRFVDSSATVNETFANSPYETRAQTEKEMAASPTQPSSVAPASTLSRSPSLSR